MRWGWLSLLVEQSPKQTSQRGNILHCDRKFKWSAANVKMLAEYLIEKKSATQIGKLMNVSRNAIIGKVHRDKDLRLIGLNGRHPNQGTGTKPKKTPSPHTQIKPARRMPEHTQVKRIMDKARDYASAAARARIKEKAGTTPAPRQTPTIACPEPFNLALVALKSNECKYPVNSWEERHAHEALFCGNLTERKTTGRNAGEWKSYCPYHDQVCSGGIPVSQVKTTGRLAIPKFAADEVFA
jgi:GcrA cell cycle regulator